MASVDSNCVVNLIPKDELPLNPIRELEVMVMTQMASRHYIRPYLNRMISTLEGISLNLSWRHEDLFETREHQTMEQVLTALKTPHRPLPIPEVVKLLVEKKDSSILILSDYPTLQELGVRQPHLVKYFKSAMILTLSPMGPYRTVITHLPYFLPYLYSHPEWSENHMRQWIRGEFRAWGRTLSWGNRLIANYPDYSYQSEYLSPKYELEVYPSDHPSTTLWRWVNLIRNGEWPQLNSELQILVLRSYRALPLQRDSAQWSLWLEIIQLLSSDQRAELAPLLGSLLWKHRMEEWGRLLSDPKYEEPSVKGPSFLDSECQLTQVHAHEALQENQLLLFSLCEDYLPSVIPVLLESFWEDSQKVKYLRRLCPDEFLKPKHHLYPRIPTGQHRPRIAELGVDYLVRSNPPDQIAYQLLHSMDRLSHYPIPGCRKHLKILFNNQRVLYQHLRARYPEMKLDLTPRIRLLELALQLADQIPKDKGMMKDQMMKDQTQFWKQCLVVWEGELKKVSTHDRIRMGIQGWKYSSPDWLNECYFEFFDSEITSKKEVERAIKNLKQKLLDHPPSEIDLECPVWASLMEYTEMNWILHLIQDLSICSEVCELDQLPLFLEQKGSLKSEVERLFLGGVRDYEYHVLEWIDSL